jgi:aryl-alcohol dehydrogenase-like predicted oxidoreductase
MEKRILGRTGLEVTVLGYGAMEIRGPTAWTGPDVGEQESEKILNAVLDSGINFIDTSPDYGLSEERIGKYISSRRKEFFLSTKCGCRPGENKHIWTRDNLLWNIDMSLKRMKVEYVDVLQLHNAPVEDVQAGKLVEVLQEIRDGGKTRWIGCSSTAPRLMEFVTMGCFDTFQIPYSALERRHEQQITAAAEAGCGIIIRGGVARGVVAEDKEQEGGRWDMWERALLDELLDGMSRLEFMLRFTNSHPHMNTNIVGTRNPEHLADNVAAAEKGPLPADIYEEAKRRLGAAGEVPL